jgi:predicted RNA polymerase sigma factor
MSTRRTRKCRRASAGGSPTRRGEPGDVGAALETWPRDGVPSRPEAWLLTAARRKLIDPRRRARVRAEAMPTLVALADQATHIATAKRVA